MTSLAISFRKSPEFSLDFGITTPDFDFETLDLLTSLCDKNPEFNERIMMMLAELIETKWKKGFEIDGSEDNAVEIGVNIRRFLILLEFNGWYKSPVFGGTFHHLLYKLLIASSVTNEILVTWLTEYYSKERLLKLVRAFHDELAEHMKVSKKDEPSMKRLCVFMDILYQSNRRKRRVNYTEFYNDTANNDLEYKRVFLKIYK